MVYRGHKVIKRANKGGGNTKPAPPSKMPSKPSLKVAPLGTKPQKRKTKPGSANKIKTGLRRYGGQPRSIMRDRIDKPVKAKPSPSDSGVYRGHKVIKRANRGGGGGNTTPGSGMGKEAKNTYKQGE